MRLAEIKASAEIDISLKRIKQEDHQLIWKALQDYLLELLNTIGNPEGKNLKEEIPYPYFESYWEEPNRYPMWAVNSEGENVGFVFLRDTGSHFSIAELYIFPGQRKKGYGKALIESIISHCQKQKPYKALFANCFVKNEQGYAFWKENDFYPVALEESPEGTFHILQKDLYQG